MDHEAFFRRCGPSLIDSFKEVTFWDKEQLAQLFRGMILPLVYLHGRRIAHRDVKPDNFLWPGQPFSSGNIFERHWQPQILEILELSSMFISQTSEFLGTKAAKDLRFASLADRRNVKLCDFGTAAFVPKASCEV